MENRKRLRCVCVCVCVVMYGTMDEEFAAGVVQRVVRGHAGRRRARVTRFLREHKQLYTAQRSVTVTIQRFWRGCRVRLHLKRTRQDFAARVIARWWRGVLSYFQYQRARRGLIPLDSETKGKSKKRKKKRGLARKLRQPAREVYICDQSTQTKESDLIDVPLACLLTPRSKRPVASFGALWSPTSPTCVVSGKADNLDKYLLAKEKPARKPQLPTIAPHLIPKSLQRARADKHEASNRRRKQRQREEIEGNRVPDFFSFAQKQKEAFPILLTPPTTRFDPEGESRKHVQPNGKRAALRKKILVRKLRSDPIIFGHVT